MSGQFQTVTRMVCNCLAIFNSRLLLPVPGTIDRNSRNGVLEVLSIRQNTCLKLGWGCWVQMLWLVPDRSAPLDPRNGSLSLGDVVGVFPCPLFFLGDACQRDGWYSEPHRRIGCQIRERSA
eukprot:3856443-Amphidinium_carterae.1